MDYYPEMSEGDFIDQVLNMDPYLYWKEQDICMLARERQIKKTA